MFALSSDITIGEFKRVKPNEVTVRKSIRDFVDRAKIKLPVTARIKRGEEITASAETAKQFSEGDKVVIKLGYNGVLKTEFEGFISRVNFAAPVELECEGYSYQLRQKLVLKTFKNAKLLEVLRFLCEGTDIEINPTDVMDWNIDKIVFNKETGTEALEKIKKMSRSLMQINFTGRNLYAGLSYTQPKADVRFTLGWNVIKDSSLKLREAKNQNVTVNYIGEKPDGTKVSVKSGNTGEVKVYKTHGITDESSLKALADAEHKKQSFDGYEGSIDAFGVPYAEPGYRVLLEDRRYQERSGNYLIETTEIKYGMSGFRRKIGIGAKL